MCIGRLPSIKKGGPGVGNNQSKSGSSAPLQGDSSPLQKVAFSVPVFCFRNDISRPKYNRLRAEGRGPVEMRLGLNTIRITADAEREWQRQMQEPAPEIEARATERAVKAGDAAVKSENHVSNQRRKRAPSPSLSQKARPSP
jgi:hypothetical protein